ncbi:MAG TPA: hypothetical protein VFL74_00445, partial [Sphingomicrobium sp.]|nr:hypothetical protein [Sphingomicrobium sp.]
MAGFTLRLSPDGLRPFSRHAVHPDGMLLSNPLDQLVELDRLLGGDQCFGLRKSIFAGGLSNPSGGSANVGHWRASARAGIGCGGVGLLAQAASVSAGRSNAAFEIISGPFVDLRLLGFDSGDVLGVRAARLLGGGAIVGDGGGVGGLLRPVKPVVGPRLITPVITAL